MTPCLHLIGHEIKIDEVNSRAYTFPITFYMLSLSGYIKKIQIIPAFHPPSRKHHEWENEKSGYNLLCDVLNLYYQTHLCTSLRGENSPDQPLGGAEP